LFLGAPGLNIDSGPAIGVTVNEIIEEDRFGMPINTFFSVKIKFFVIAENLLERLAKEL
jgi:hypothetical protein